MFKRKQRKTLKRLVEEKIAKSAIESLASQYMEDHKVKEAIKTIKNIMDKLPANGHKTNIGDILMYIGLIGTIAEQSQPLLQAMAGFLPQYAIAIGAAIAIAGKVHQISKIITEKNQQA